MPDTKAGGAGLAGALSMPDWKAGGDFTASQLRLDEHYRMQRIRRHLRLSHGWGVICGLNVVPANDSRTGWELFVCPGYGIGPCGDEIVVNCRFRFNLKDYLWTQPLRSQGTTAWIAIEATSNPTDYVAAPEPACGCGCGGAGEKPSRFEDGFRIVVSWTAPLLRRGFFDICRGGTPACPPCPESCALPLAVVTARSWNDPVAKLAVRRLEEV